MYEALRQGFATLGYVDGKNIQFLDRFVGRVATRNMELAEELVRMNVDVIVAIGPAAYAAKKATSKIPVVFVLIHDPVNAGFVTSFGRPGGNMTGLSSMGANVASKRVQLLKDCVPSIASAALLLDPGVGPKFMEDEISETRAGAFRLGMSFQAFEAREAADLEPAFEGIAQGRFGSVIVSAGPMLWNERSKIADLVARRGILGMGVTDQYVDHGLLMSYGPSWPAIFRGAGGYVKRILEGESPAEIPVQRPTQFDLVLNLRTAKATGLAFPPAILVQATRVIE